MDIIEKRTRTTTLNQSSIFSVPQMMMIFWDFHTPATLDGSVHPLMGKTRLCRAVRIDRFVERVPCCSLPLLVFSEIPINAFSEVSSSGFVKLLPRADAFLLHTSTSELLLGVQWRLGSELYEAQLAGSHANAIGTAFFGCLSMLLRPSGCSHCKWLCAPWASEVHSNPSGEVLLLLISQAQTTF